MFLAIDVGGTKTLISAFTQDGKIRKSIKLVTPKTYDKFLSTIKATLLRFDEYKFNYACIAIPGKVDRKNGIGVAFGNLKWSNIPIKKDLRAFLKCPLAIENDANLAGLYEANNVINDYKKTVYITVSTGIGSGIIIDGKIDPYFADSEIGHIMVQFGDKTLPWEKVASGSAIKKRYNKLASEISSRTIWREISYNLAIGLTSLIATVQPEAIIIGGSVGTYFRKYQDILKKELAKLSTPLTPTPVILKAKKPEEAVIYGCYQLAKINYAKLNK